jgi:hypothetical protein
MGLKKSSKLIERTIQEIRNVCGIKRDNQQICLKKLDPEQISKIKLIISNSGFKPGFICRVLGVNYEKIYKSKHQKVKRHAKAKNRKIKNYS